MNFNPWQDYLNLRDVFFCEDWKRNNGRSFSEIETYHLVQQGSESFSEDNTYFQNFKNELMKAMMNLTKSTEEKMKAEKIKQMTETTESILKEKRKIKHMAETTESILKEKQKIKQTTETTESILKEKQKIKQTTETTESILKEKQTNSKFYKEEKIQNVTIPCSFCRRNGEQKIFYMSHNLKNSKGQVMCPILQKYVCPKCQATGLNAHTLLYCPQNNEYQSASLTHLTPRMSSGRKRHF